MSWTFPVPIAGAGAAMPNLQRVGHSLLLSGGRMCGNATSDIFLWLNRDGLAGVNDFEPFSLSYWHNTLLSNVTCNPSNSRNTKNETEPCRFDQGVNTSCRTETYGGTRLMNFDNVTGAVSYGIHGIYYSMNFTLDGEDTVPGMTRHIPVGTGDKANCISAHEDKIATPFNTTPNHGFSGSGSSGGGSVEDGDFSPPGDSAAAESDAEETSGEQHDSMRISAPVIFRACTNVTSKGNNRHPSKTHCFNATTYPTDGGQQPLTLIGAHFSGPGVNGAKNPTCRIDPVHGANMNVHKGENPNTTAISDNYITFSGSPGRRRRGGGGGGSRNSSS
eukprot:SAG22_NODE_4524_length_1243_cov_1.980769_1_plen_331_part_10